MELKTYTIELENVKLFQYCLNISSSLHGNGVINLSIQNDGILSTTSNAMDSCYKHWFLPLANFAKVPQNILTEPIKCSIFKGNDFIKKILPQLVQKDVTSSITFHYDEILSSVKQISIVCTSTITKKKVFTFKFNTSDVSLLFTEFDDETIEFFFSDKSPSKLLYQFELLSTDLTKLRSMLNLNVHDDTQNSFISIKFDTEEKQISFTDEITDFRLSQEFEFTDEQKELTTFNIDKTIFKTIDNETFVVQLREYEDTKLISLTSKNEMIVYITVIPLLEDIKSTISYTDILNDTGKFG